MTTRNITTQHTNVQSMRKIPTVTIAVCAYNEAHNIVLFLRSVALQKERGFSIKEIILISDGSTDATVSLAENLLIPKLIIRVNKSRKGKSLRLNDLYKNLSSDFLVQTDADVIFSHPRVVEYMLRPLINNKHVVMCGGNPQPLPAVTFIEAAINHSTKLFMHFRSLIREGNNVFSADGRMLAYRKEFIQFVRIPKTMIANDMYTYFCCKNEKREYRYVKSAVVHYRSPQIIQDHLKQNTRFRAGPVRMNRYFSSDLVHKEMSIPTAIFLKYYLIYLFKNPLLSIYIVSINLYCRVNALVTEKKMLATWNIAGTTKELA
ncbi:hypothetical protein BH11PAT1_BH11PAT1_4600 [soil metagenome]